MKLILIILLVPQILVLTVPMSSWLLMVFYMGTMFLSLKVATLITARPMNWSDTIIYTTAWIGMDPVSFQTKALKQAVWNKGIFCLLIGLALLIVSIYTETAGLKAFTLFIAMLFIFHFGLLDLNAQVWTYFGRKTQAIMNEPWKAYNLADFWGNRWNMAFRDAVHRILFRPVRKILGTKAALLTVFIFSGIMHEAVISVPAQGGYGGPLVYFMLQFLGISLQKKFHCINNRLSTWLFLCVPLPLLFHKDFFLNVFIPLTNAIGG